VPHRTIVILLALSASLLLAAPSSSQAPADPGCHAQALTPRLASSKRYVYERATLRCDQTNDGLAVLELLWRPPGGKPKRIAGGQGTVMTFEAGRVYTFGGPRGRNWTLLCVRAVHAGPPRRTVRPVRRGHFASRIRYYVPDPTETAPGPGRLVASATSSFVRNRCPRPPRTVHVK
jgi:hypothetical protein